MAWDLIFLILFFFICFALIGMSFHQYINLTDLEVDYLNPFEATSKINQWVIPEFALQGALCLLCLLTGHWVMFLLSLPITCFHASLFIKRKHLLDVTEVFRFIGFEKKSRMVKLTFYLCSATYIVISFIFRGFELIKNEDVHDHIF